jgi:hypothetical protein
MVGYSIYTERFTLPIWIITIVYLLLGFYIFEKGSLTSWFIYPTYYHFIASIVVLYVPYYFVVKNNYLYQRIPFVMLFIFIIQLAVYALVYDKSYYHIDVVREPMIRFLFFQSMLLGLYFRQQHYIKYVDSNKVTNWMLLICSIGVYFVTKIVFSRIDDLSHLQIINQITIFIALYFMFKCFAGVNSHLEQMPNLIKISADFIARITLQIYAVQYVIIPNLANLAFPINWIIITTTIILSAYALYIVGTKTSKYLEEFIDDLVLKKKKRVG